MWRTHNCASLHAHGNSATTSLTWMVKTNLVRSGSVEALGATSQAEGVEGRLVTTKDGRCKTKPAQNACEDLGTA